MYIVYWTSNIILDFKTVTTGTVKAKIVEQEVFEVPTVENLTQDVPYVIVYTEQGATAQIVF